MDFEIDDNNLRHMIIRVPDNVKIRKEYFGGMIFNSDTGDIIEVDKEACKLILAVKDSRIVCIDSLIDLLNEINTLKVISKLITTGVFEVLPKGILTDEHNIYLSNRLSDKVDWPVANHLSAPETVHWAVTYKCDESCPDCYIKRYKSDFTKELDTHEAHIIIDKIAKSGVFQLAIGGGEPFKRNDLEQLVKRAKEMGLVTHITTGMYEIDQKRLDDLSGNIKTLQVGIRAEEFKDKKTEEKLRRLVMMLTERGIIPGANLIMNKDNINEFDALIRKLKSAGFGRITLLRYKPPAGISRWLIEKPDETDLLLLEEKLRLIYKSHTDMVFRVDCALAFSQRFLDPKRASDSGIRGCTAGERIFSVAPNGSVYPCSQLTGERFVAGNLFLDEFYDIWNKSDILNRYRCFRDEKTFLNQACGICDAKYSCGGCRVFAPDSIGADPGCPKVQESENAYNDRDYPLWMKNSKI